MEPEKRKKNMEALVFALIAVRNGYNRRESIVPEPAEFQPFDLRALKQSYGAENNSSSRPSDRQKALVPQVAS
jgi:hypothetical protein